MKIALLFTLLPGLALAATEPVSSPTTLAISTSWGVVHVEKITVHADNEDLDPPAKGRWTRFEEALGPGRVASGRYQAHAWRNNDGSRVECYSPCVNNCCAYSGGLSLLGAGFGGK